MRIAPLLFCSLLSFSAVPLFAQSSSPASEASAEEALSIGSPLPFGSVPLPDIAAQKAVMLDSMFGPQGLLVMFSCNTCPYVVKSQARTLQIIQMAKAKKVGVVIINSNEARRADDDSPQAMLTYAAKQGYTVPYLMDVDSRAADVFGATRTPEVFLFNAGRKLVYKGAMEDNPASPKESKKLYLESAINKMTAGKLPDPSSTKSIGCSIKRKQS